MQNITQSNFGFSSIDHLTTAVVHTHNGTPATNSLVIAEKFNKRHDAVLRDISRLECSEDFTAHNFVVSEYKDKSGKKNKYFIITRDGFMFLAMGFTGKEAALWKEKFINAFNELEKLQKPTPPTLNIRALLIPDEKEPEVPISAELAERIDQKAFEMAGEALQLCRQYLRRRLTDLECGPADDRFIFRDDALKLIQNTTLGNALAHVWLRKMEHVKFALNLFKTLSNNTEKEFEDMCQQHGIQLN